MRKANSTVNVSTKWTWGKWKYLSNKKMMYGANEPAQTDSEDLPRYIRITDIDKYGNLKPETFKSLPMEKAEPYLLQEGDILLARSGATVGKSYIHSDKSLSCFAGYLIKYSPNSDKVLPYFVYYFTQSSYFKNWVLENTVQATIQNVSAERYGNVKMPIPPLSRQKEIVSFLNQKTSEIDTLIADKEKLIELLEEKRQAVITEAVTKGLDPDVPMKDSGVEWVREIPNHWEVSSLNLHLKESKTKNIGNKETNVLSLSYGRIKKRDVESNFGLLPESFETYRIVKGGDIVLRLTDLQNDKKSLRVGLVKEDGIITSAYLTLVPTENVSSEYASFLLHVYDLHKVFYGFGSGVRQSIGYQDLKKLPILLPPKEEQLIICNYLNSFIKYVNGVLGELKEQIEKLKEYRQSLIYEAVTGKIDVQEMETEIKQEEVSSP